MQDQSCDQTIDVRAAMESGQWRPDTLRHALDCEACQDFWISTAIRTYARAKAPRQPSVNADIVWWKGQLQQKHQRLKRATLPIAVAQILAVVAGFVAVFALAAPGVSRVAGPLVMPST